MLANEFKSRLRVVSTLAGLLLACGATLVNAQPTQFMAVLNEGTSNADSRKSVTFFDGSDPGAGPLFSVFVPFEIHGGSSNTYEEPNGITVDPATGDIYMVAFDSGPAALTEGTRYDNNGTGVGGSTLTGDDDGISDLDVYRLNFQTVFDHWKTNYMGQDIRSVYTGAHPLKVGGNVPTPTAGTTATELQDYVTYGVTTPWVTQIQTDAVHCDPMAGNACGGIFDADDFDNGPDHNSTPSHSNTFVLGDMVTGGGAIEKVGEIARNRYTGASSFHKTTLQFIDPETFVIVDDARQPKNTGHSTANDQDIRLVERVSTSPGLADPMSVGGLYINGGYNSTTSESWESRRIAQVSLDGDETTSGSFLSEIQATAYYDAGSVQGMWVAERDRGNITTYNPVPDVDSGDDIAFLAMDASGNSLGYKTISNFAATKFEMLNNPAAPDGFAGRVGRVFVDSDTGDLIIVEEGFTDAVGSGGPGLSEPATIRVPVNYDDAGQITLGAWGTKMVLGANGGITKDTDDTFRENGFWSAYDSATDTVYFMSPGEAVAGIVDPPGETPPDPSVHFAADIYTMNVNTGLTNSYMNIDNSVSLFFISNTGNNTPSGDVLVAFSLEEPGLDGDYNEDGKVDAADYVVWRKNPGDFGGAAGYTTWAANFGAMAPGSGGGSAAGSVPEPASLVLLAMGLAVLSGSRRRASR